MSSPPTPHLTNLPPDLFAECLHFLPPAEISRTSLQLSKSFRNVESSERAAWLAIKHMASTAEKWTKEQNDNLTEVDPDAAEARRLLRDHEIFGHLAFAADTKNSTSSDDGMTRFEDESWSMLYKLLRDVLDKLPNANQGGLDGPDTVTAPSFDDADEEQSTSNTNNENDETEGLEEHLSDNSDDNSSSSSTPADTSTPCSIALTMWLAFGGPTLPPLSSASRRALSMVADRICLVLTSRSETTIYDQYKKRLKSRAIQMALRLGQLGCWDVGSMILDDNIDERVLQEARAEAGKDGSTATSTTIDPPPIDIDCAISVTNFLIDRLYSQTYVRDSDEDTQALCRAAQLGRWAVRNSLRRHAAFREKQRNSANANNESSSAQNISSETGKTVLRNKNSPPPPVTSIFSDDCMRFLHALLAQAKALALLAQHVALGASDVRTLEFFPVHRHPLTINPSTEHELVVAAHIVASSFFSDSSEIFAIASAVVKEQEPYKNEKDDDNLLRLTYAFQASQGEHFYCAASANTRWSHPVFSPIDTDDNDDLVAECIRRSIRLLKETFAQILYRVFDGTMNFDYELLSLAMRTAKDLGKACDFAERTGNSNITLTDAGMYLEFAYLCSCFLLGSMHPSTSNIERLHRIRPEDALTIADQYNRVMPWLVENYAVTRDGNVNNAMSE